MIKLNIGVCLLATAWACGPNSHYSGSDAYTDASLTPSIVGTWHRQASSAEMTVVFRADGTLQIINSATPTQFPGCMLRAEQNGTYTVSGDELTTMLPAAAVAASGCPSSLPVTTIRSSNETHRFIATESTLTIFAPADAQLPEAGAVEDHVVLTRQ